YLVSGGLAFACTCHSCTYPFSSSTARTNQSAINSLLSGTNGFQNSAGTLTLGSKGNNALAGRDLKYHPDPTSDDFDSTLETLTSAVLAEDSSWWNTGWRGGVPSAVWDDTYTSPGAHGKPYELGRRRTRRGVFANPTQTTI
ncbi:MAG: hypothetical protein ACE5EX_11375, partial [Phycisphaerae bacterium]